MTHSNTRLFYSNNLKLSFISLHFNLCLQNAMRATIETHDHSNNLPPIKVLVSLGGEDMSIKVGYRWIKRRLFWDIKIRPQRATLSFHRAAEKQQQSPCSAPPFSLYGVDFASTMFTHWEQVAQKHWEWRCGCVSMSLICVWTRPHLAGLVTSVKIRRNNVIA